MAKPNAIPQRTPAANDPDSPSVRLEVRNGAAKPITYELSGEEFLIGSVPGCDLRLPGTSLPPVVCLITRQPDGVRLRKLAPTLPVLVNGQPISQNALTSLNHGDVISIGAADLHVLGAYTVPSAPQFVPIQQAPPPVPVETEDATRRQGLLHRQQELEARQRALEEKEHELEADRVLWYRRREEFEREMRERPVADTTALDKQRSELDRRAGELDARDKALQAKEAEIAKDREEVAKVRQDLNERFRERRDQLARTQEAIRQAQAQLQKRQQSLEDDLLRQRQETESDLFKRKQQFEVEHRQRAEAAAAELAQLDAELKKRREEAGAAASDLRQTIEREVAEQYRQKREELERLQASMRDMGLELRQQKQQFEEDRRTCEPRLQELTTAREALQREQQAWAERLRDFEARERTMAEREARFGEDRNRIEQGLAQYQADLARIDRLQAALEDKESRLQARALELDERWQTFQRDGGDLEAAIHDIDARQEALRKYEEQAALRSRELEQRESALNVRAAQVEGQQSMLTTLRARLEEMREQVRADVLAVAAERSRHDEMMRESQERLREAERIRESLVTERLGNAEGQKLFAERSALMQQAATRLRELQEQLKADDERQRTAAEELAAREAKLAEQAAVVEARAQQILELQQRLEADRDALRVREAALMETDGTRGALQEQLVRRSEELAARSRELDEKSRALDDQTRLLNEQADALEKLRGDAAAFQAATQGQTTELTQRDEELRVRSEQLRQAEEAVAEQRRLFEEARQQWEREQAEAVEKHRQSQHEIAALREALTRQAGDLFQQMPALEQRAQAALERTGQAREQLRGQLSELHAYARQSQEDIESLRNQVQAEMERLRQQEASLSRSRSEHRLAVASFKQQLVEWQSRFGEMRQALSRNESRIGQRAAQVEATSQQLAKQAEEIQVWHREVSEKRTEMERHLNDMREWYRRKLRELVESKGQGSGVRGQETNSAGDSGILPLPAAAEQHGNGSEGRTSNPVILSLNDDLDPNDRRLGELLRSLELVDADTLSALWYEARRQRRPLRQVLLAGNYLTLYQPALIEADSLDKLVLGRFRIIDRLQHTSRESIYRAFDPQLVADRRAANMAVDGTVLLRQLSEAEVQDSVHPDEYRQRFSAARDLAHPNIAATLEVLDINGRPAAVQEWLTGLAGSDWPALVAVPGVWYRLLSQAALGLHTAHQAGLIHGRLSPNSFLLTADGVLKIAGFGEPPWLMPSIGPEPEATVAADLRDLGQAALGWSQLQAPKPKRGKAKQFAAELLGVLIKLGADTGSVAEADFYPNAAALLEDLDQIGAEIEPAGDAWDKLLEHVGENKSDGPLLRRTA